MANVPRVRRIGSRWAYCDDLFVVANRFVTKLRHSPLQRGRLVLRPPPCFPLCLDNLSLRKRGFFLRSIQSAQRIRIVSLRHGRRCAPGRRVGWGARHRGPCHLRIQRSRIARAPAPRPTGLTRICSNGRFSAGCAASAWSASSKPPGDGPHVMVRLLARVIGVGVETADMLVQEGAQPKRPSGGGALWRPHRLS